MFKKIKEYKDAYQQGKLDSLADNAYLMAIVLVSLIYDITVETDTQLEKFYQDIISVLYDFNPDFRELQIPSSDIEDIYNSYTQQLLNDALSSYKDDVLDGPYERYSSKTGRIKEKGTYYGGTKVVDNVFE